MASFLQNIIIGKHYGGIEIFSQSSNLAFIEVEQKKDELVIINKVIHYGLDDLFKKKYKFPIALVINNDNILHREVHYNDSNDKKLLNKAFPNISTEDFYYEIWRRDAISIVTICRKAYIDDLIDNFNGKINIASISLGIVSLSSVAGLNMPTVITTNIQKINLAEDQNIISTLTDGNEQSYDINGLAVSNKFLLSFCASLGFVLPVSTTGNINQLNENLLERLKQNAFFSKGFKFGISIILAILLFNFILFSYFFDKTTVLTQTMEANKADIENIARLKEKIKDKELKLKSFASTVSASSAIINNLVKQMPSSLLLKEIIYHPLEKKVKSDEAIITIENEVTITGTSTSNEAFTSWVHEMQQNTRVKNVTITSFSKNLENQTVFSLNIKLKNEVKQEE